MNNPTKKSLWVFLTIFIVQYGSAVFGFDVNECVQDIFKKFDEKKTSKKNFIFAFENFNHAYFSNPTKNKSAHGYFKDLFDSIEQTGANGITHPILFCDKYENEQDKMTCKEALALLLSNEEGNPDAKKLRLLEVPENELLNLTHVNGDPVYFSVGDDEAKPEVNLLRALDKTEIEILKHCYLTQTKLDLTLDKVFPYQYEVMPEGHILDPQNEYRSALKRKAEGDAIKKKKIEIMHGYFDHLLNAAKRMADFAVFKFPLAYCISILDDK